MDITHYLTGSTPYTNQPHVVAISFTFVQLSKL